MATQTINYLPQIDRIDTVDEHKIVERSSQLITDSLVGSSRWAEKARRLVAAHSAHDNTVIFEGEPGTGKQFLARLIHQCSRYAPGPFVSVALGSTTGAIARDVLFGRTRMQADDMPGSEKGLIELALGGTLYIDGLMDTSPRLTGDIARFIEYARFNRKGDGSLRILFSSTTHSTGCHWRSSVSPKSEGLSCEKIQIPPLRERPDDIEPLAALLIKQSCEQMHK
jgi:DNA-binding NtrC family response regulator